MMMKAPMAALGVGLSLSLGLATAGNAWTQDASPIGRWRTTAQNGVVEITPCGASLCGRLIDADPLRRDPEQRDIRNRDAALRDRPLRGLPVMLGFSGGPQVWRGGPLYDPNSGQGAIQGTLRLIDADTLSIQGCIAPLLCRTQTWRRLR